MSACHLQIRMNQAKLPEVTSWAGITQGMNSVNLHAVLYSMADKKYGLFFKTYPPVSFVMSKFQKQNLVKVPFHFVSQQKTKSSAAVFDVVLAYGPFEINCMAYDSMNAFYLFIFESFVNKTLKRSI